MPPNRCLIESKWAFKKKGDGQLRARIDTQRYTQIPGVDFTENYSTVVTDVTLHVILILWLIKNWDSDTIHVERAFLYALLEK